MNEEANAAIQQADEIESQLKGIWFQVCLKSGQTLTLKANWWEVSLQDVQEEDTEDPTVPAIKETLVMFYGEDGHLCYDMYLPFSEVACIRQLNRLQIASEDFDEMDAGS